MTRPRAGDSPVEGGGPGGGDGPGIELASGDATIGISEEMTIVSWNAAAEQLTSRPAEEALGRACWEALGAVDGAGDPICAPDCRIFRLALAGRDVGRLVARLPGSPEWRRLSLATLGARLGSRRLVVHVLPADEPGGAGGIHLTGRQREILLLLEEGLTTAEIAGRLVLSTTTVRNHIQAILRAFRAHSRLEALALARRTGLV